MKSQVNVQLEVALSVYYDAWAKCVANPPDLRDVKYITSRVQKEGLSFLTITLPAFADGLNQALARGRVESIDFPRMRRAGSIPAFLQGLTSLLFDRETGDLHELTVDSASFFASVVDAIRQICLASKKIEIACTPERTYKAIREFVQIEHDLSAFGVSVEDERDFSRVSHLLWGNVLSGFSLDECIPRHGPGATVERISGNQKYRFRLWHDRLEPYFPLIDNAYQMGVIETEELDELTVVKKDQEAPARVSPVPKTQKGPRIIAIEPVCMQYAQQGLQKWLYARLEKHRLTRGRINFRSQKVNQLKAVVGSRRGSLSTIDLSEASDRVPLSLVQIMLSPNRDFHDATMACRTDRAILPDGTIVGPLKKFASMGSALCFPIEGMYFYTVCIVLRLRQYELPVTLRNIHRMSRRVYVYGDDIIVPKASATAIRVGLRKYNCKVNTRKSFSEGNFRESCGVEAYAGYEVTPLYIRRLSPTNRRQVSEIISAVESARLFYKKGYWRTASLLFEQVEKIVGPLPYIRDDSSGLGRVSYLEHCYHPHRQNRWRWNRKLHRYEVMTLVPSPVYFTDELDGYAALQKCLTLMALRPMGEYPETLKTHLEESARYGSVALKRRWVPAT